MDFLLTIMANLEMMDESLAQTDINGALKKIHETKTLVKEQLEYWKAESAC